MTSVSGWERSWVRGPPSRHHHRCRLHRARYADTTTTARMSDFVALERVTTWAARGESTVIQAAPATCRRRCMRSRSNSIRFGVAATPADKRSGTAHGVARSATGWRRRSASVTRCWPQPGSPTAPLAGEHQPRRVDLQRADHRDWPAFRTEDPKSSGLETFQGKVFTPPAGIWIMTCATSG
jgi:hypothetical protein